jgi:hypothetical protein
MKVKQEPKCGLCLPDGLTKAKHIPERMCIGCRERNSKESLIRVGEGRGAYVHDNPDCIIIALKKRSFDRALKGKMGEKMNILTTLGLCKRAGKIITGFDAVVTDIQKSAGIIITSNLSEKTKKEINYHCTKHNKKITEINHTMNEIESVLGKKTGIISILDEGLYKALTANK